MIAFTPPPPDTTHMRNRISLQVRVAEYGSWSSSGQRAQPLSASHSRSGENVLQERHLAPLRQAVDRLTEVATLAHAQNVLFSLQTLNSAFDLLANFHLQLAPLSLHAPHITWSSDAEVVLEWRHNQKRLLFYVKENSVEYLKSWGSDIYEEMEEGQVFSPPEVARLWRWLKN